MGTFRALFLAAACAFSAVARAQQNPPQWTSTASYLGGTLVRGSDGNFYRAIHDSTNKNPTLDNHSSWELYYVRVPTVLPVAMSGARFTSIRQAWAFLGGAQIPGNATVDIHISTKAGAYLEKPTGPFALDHASGSQITITGDDAASVKIQFPSGVDGFTLGNNHTFGGINGLTVDGSGINQSVGGTAITVSDGATLLSSNVGIQNIYAGLLVLRRAKVYCDGITVSNIRDAIRADEDGYIHCKHATVTNALDGFSAVEHSMIVADYSYANPVTGVAFGSEIQSNMSAYQCEADHATTAFYASSRSAIDCSHSSMNFDSQGVTAVQGSYVTASSTSMNQVGTPFSPSLNQAGADQSFISG